VKATGNATLSLKRINRAFALLALCLVSFAAAYSWISWQASEDNELRHATELVDIGEKSLNAYFSQIEFVLRLSSQDLLDERGRMDPIAAQSRLIGLTKANLDLVSANIISLDGFIIFSSNPGAKLPAPVPNMASFNHYIDELAKRQSLSIGLPFIGPFAKEWLIPFRYAVRDTAGNLRYVLTATMPLSRPQSFWKDAALPAGMALGLIRDDGYLVSRYPVPASLGLAEIYGKPRTGALIKYLQERQFPVSGHVEGPSSLDGPSHLIVFRRLSSHPLTLFLTQPVSNVRANWWSSVQVPYLLLLILLAGGFVVFRWMLRAQNAWEAERNDAERTLADFKAALDEHAIVATTDARGTITYVNDKFCAISKYAREELIGQNHRIINSGHHPKAFFGELWKTIGSGGIWKGEIKNRAKDGMFYWVDTTIVPVLDEHGKPTQYIAIRADITARKQDELALVVARNAAEQANRAKDSFLATMSHEIRTPLGGLMGMLELLSLSSLGDEQHETLQAARDSGRSLLRILNDILDWSKIEEGKLELAPQAVSIAGVLAGVVNTYARVASANSMILAQQVDARLSPVLIVDSLRLSQVLNNFVSNALKFSQRGGRVEVRAELIERREGAEQVRFSVQDTGIGIDSEVQQRLFQSYGQGSADTARMYGGTGLGLAICRRLADLMDGRIGVDSAPGRGSTFSITLTLLVSEAAVEDVQGAREVGAEASVLPLVHAVAQAEAPLVLVVDDHPINRRLLARQLGLLGLRAEIAENGEAALPLLRDGRFALVITDCHMPKMDGYALARAIRRIEADEARPRTPIFAWTANALADEEGNCRAAGMDELLVKPAGLTQLRAVLSKWLASAATMAVGPVDAGQDGPGGTAPIDLAALDQIAANAADRTEILRDFLAQTRSDLTELEAALNDLAATERLAHRMKGACRMVGARELETACEALQGAARQGNPEDARAAKAALDLAMARLDAHLAQAAGANRAEE